MKQIILGTAGHIDHGKTFNNTATTEIYTSQSGRQTSAWQIVCGTSAGKPRSA